LTDGREHDKSLYNPSRERNNMSNNAMPFTTPTTDARDMGTHKRLEAIAGSVLARLPKNGRPVSLAAVTARLWGAGTSQCRADTVTVLRKLEALCKGTGVQCAVKRNPHNKGDYIITLRY